MVLKLGAFIERPVGRTTLPPDILNGAADHLDRLLAPDTTLPWYRSIFGNITEAVHPKPLPPLELTSKPVELPETWGLYRTSRKSGFMSVLIHVGLFGLLWSITTSPPATQLVRQITTLIAPAPYHPTEPPKVEVRLEKPPNSGSRRANGLAGNSTYTPPKPIMRHYTPPPPTDRPPLATAPQLLIPPEWVGTTDPNAHYGDPLAGLLGAAGNFGTGMGMGGTANGSGTGVGRGFDGGRNGGAGSGSGRTPVTGDPIYTAAKGMTPPEPVFRPDAEYTEEARKAALNGKVVLSIVVETDGTASNIEVTRSLGLGLEQKAVEAVSQWKFKPATIAGKPVRARVNVEVAFRLMLSLAAPPQGPSPDLTPRPAAGL